MQNKINQFLEWYKRPDVKFEIIKSLQNREFACLVPSWCPKEMQKTSTRTLRCHNVDHLDVILWRILDVAYKKNLYNLYYSMAKYLRGIPYQNPNLAERNNHEWVKSHYQQMIWYDWLIDIDADSHEDINEAYEVAKTIKSLLDRYEIIYQVRFSGKGFHFIVLYNNFAYLNHGLNPWEDNNLFKFLINCTEKLNKQYSSLIDWKHCSPDSRRVCKIPYSLAFYENDTYVCIPFTSDSEFNNWTLKRMLPSEWSCVRNRHNLIFNEYKTPKFTAFLKKIGGYENE